MGTYDDYQDLRHIVDRTVDDLENHVDEFDFIAVRGVSGLMVGSPVGLALNKPIVVVRKEHERAHSSFLANETGMAGDRYLILDDFVSTGTTRDAIVTGIRDYPYGFLHSRKPYPVAQYMYKDDSDSFGWSYLTRNGKVK